MKGLGADGPYWTALAAGRLELPRCARCGLWRWPAPFRCAACGGWDFDWIGVKPEGELFSWTRTWHAFDGTEKLGSPYMSMLVALPQAGGIRLLGLAGEAATPRIGEAMQGRLGTSHVFGRDIPVIYWSKAHA